MNHRTLRTLTLSLIALSFTACETTDTAQYIFLDTSETLFVNFRHSVNPNFEISAPDIADSMRRSRREDFERVMQELLYEFNFPMQVHILRENEKPGDGPVLNVYAFRFEQDSSGDLVATIKARLSKYGELNTLGTYSHRDIPPPGMSRERMDKAFRDVLRKPLREMVNDLTQHFETPEETKMVNEPLLNGEE